MDPITMAIVAALTAGAISGLTDVGKQTITDAYTALKNLLKKKFGHQSEISKAAEGVETRPDSAGRQSVLHEEIVAAHADQDPELLKAAQEILNRISSQPGGNQYIQNIRGKYVATTQGGGTATININHPQEK
jgi:hypothetical protein